MLCIADETMKQHPLRRQAERRERNRMNRTGCFIVLGTIIVSFPFFVYCVGVITCRQVKLLIPAVRVLFDSEAE